MKKGMKKSMKWIVITLLILIVLAGITLAFALPGLNQTAALTIEAVDLTQIPDGSYTGSYNSYRWSTTVEVTVRDHRITEILPVKIQSGRDSLNKELRDKVLLQQSAAVDVVSGATASSNAYLKAVESALKNGIGA